MSKLVDKEKLKSILVEYFSLNNTDGSYTYELTRCKSAVGVGTMSLDDFREWDEYQVDDLTNYILQKLAK